MKNKSWLARVLSHNWVLMIIAFILSFTAWFIISANSQTETNVTISDIPITIELSEEAQNDGLQIFSGNDVTASVEVAGNRVTVGSLTASDITVTANQTNSIIGAGTYTLPLSAKKTGLKTNYEIVSDVTPANITIFVDKLKEDSFDIENQIKYTVGDGNYVNASLSETVVTVSGPETEVSQIATVAVQGTVEGTLSNTQTIEKELVYLDENGEALDLQLTTADVNKVEVTLSVYPVVDVSLNVEVLNAPSSYPKISISPSSIKVAGPKDALSEITDNKFTVGSLDFSKLTNEKIVRNFDLALPKGCKVISGETSASVSVDLSSYVKSTITCKIASNIDSDKYKTDFASTNVDITVFGPEDVIEDLTASGISVIADFTGLLDDKISSTVSLQVPLSVTLTSSFSECWVYGYYTANVNVSEK
ncbi:MAG: hypothetical protein IJH32_09360 [Ruminococcus sp.]|nr:hypothetical protein [Ruminococcus sp.]